MRNRTNGPVRRPEGGLVPRVVLHHAGFTLIEMLMVLVIMSIIMGIGIPAITNLMKSSGLGSGARQVSNALSFARQYAITQRIYARVVFPYAVTGSQPDMQYRTYAVMTNSVNTGPAANWRYASKWEYLPVGVVFLDTTVALTTPGALNNANFLNPQAGLPFPDSSSGNGQLAYIEFGPTGAATALTAGGGSGASTLAITEGFVTSGSKPTPTSKTSAGTALANVTIITVDSLVGRIKVTRP